MAYRIYIANFEVQERLIDGFDSIKVQKDLKDVYWGYWNEDGFGFGTEGGTKVTIMDELASAYIRKVFERDGFSANIDVQIINEETGQKVDLLIDFADYAEVDCCFVQCSFAPKGGGSLLASREKVNYALQLTEDIQVPIRELPTRANFSIPPITVNDLAYKNHYVPLLVGENTFEGGERNNVLYTEQKEFATFNITDIEPQCMNIEGSIKLTVSAANSGTFKSYLKVNSTVSLIDTYPITTTPVDQTITISKQINVNTGDKVYLYIESQITTTSIEFQYDASSIGISIEKCSTTPIVWKPVKAISVRNAFATIIRNATNQTSSLVEYIFDSCDFDGYLTNNDGLQNIKSTINVTLLKLFEELNNKFPASIDIIGNSVRVISRCDFLSFQTPYRIEPSDVTREVNTQLLYSDVKVGYNNWKAEGKFGSLEYNSARDYQTAFTISSSSLSLLNDWSSSSSIISEQIEKKKEKEEIHWIIVKDAVAGVKFAETDEYIDANVYQNDRAINLRITPTRNLYRWRKFILSDLRFAGGSGNYNFSSTDSLSCGCTNEPSEVDENQDINSESILGKFVYNIELDTCGIDIAKLKGAITFDYCGKEVKAFVKSVEYSISQTKSEIITVRAYELT